MKTKNIFRMLLVATALLMGANNVKAEETIVWEGNQTYKIDIPASEFANISEGTILRVYAEEGGKIQIGYCENYQIYPYWQSVFEWGSNGFIESSANDYYSFYNTTEKCYKFVLTETEATAISQKSIAFNCEKNVTKVTIETSGGGGGGTTDPVDVSLSFDPTSLSVKYGQTVSGPAITATANNTTVTGLTYTYTSNNTSIATVSNTGDVTGVAVGSTTITVSWGAITGYNAGSTTYNVTVGKADASITFGGNVELTFGDTFTPPTVTTTPTNATVTYTTSNPNVVFIGEDGSIVPVGVVENEESSTATITGSIAESTNYTAASASYTVTVNKPTRQGAVWNGALWLNNFDVHPTISKSIFSTAQSGGYLRFYGTVGPKNGTYWKFEIVGPTWDDPRLIAVDANNCNQVIGDSNGFGDGYIDIPVDNVNLNSISQVILNGQNLTITAIEVIAPAQPTESISFSPNEVDFVFGGTYQAPAVTKTPADASVTYSSSDINVAAIDGNGNVVPVGEGTATITGTIANTNVSATYTLNVTAPTRTGAVWNGAAWLGSYCRENYGGGFQPSIPTTNLQTAQVGDIIRFYGKLGPLGLDVNESLNNEFIWRVEVHDASDWTSLADINSADVNNSSDNANFQKGYFDMVIDDDILNKLNRAANLKLNGHNLTITAVELINGVPPVQKYTVTPVYTSHGTFTLSADDANIAEGLEEGTTVTITAMPSSGYQVGDISISYDSFRTVTYTGIGNNQYTFEMPAANVTVTVTFTEIDQSFAVNMGDYNYRTYVNSTDKLDFSRAVDVEGYVTTAVNTTSTGSEVHFVQVTGVCPAGTPLLLKKTGSNCKLWKSEATATLPAAYQPLLVAGTGAPVQDAYIYVLTYHAGKGLNGNGYVFAETTYQEATVPTDRAYLDLRSSNANARGQVSIRLMKGDESTGISNIEAEQTDTNVIYDLRGQRVEHPTKGLYIINGKKVVIK